MTAFRLAVRRLDTSFPGFEDALEELIAFEVGQDARIDAEVAAIVDAVRERGDAAVLQYTRRFDKLEMKSVAELEIGGDELLAAYEGIGDAERDALNGAAKRIRDFHAHQRGEDWSFRDGEGNVLGQRVTPLDSVGIYVPGGKAAYPSSVLMNALPAKVAGVREIVMMVPTPSGVRNPLVLAAAQLAGVSRVFAVGGAQAIAALAYGTATIARVDKICGPGNAYVAAAKRRVFGTVGIDMVAGASEIMIIADASANPDWVVLDLFSQAEHDELAQAILVSPDGEWLDAVELALHRWLAQMPRAGIIAASFARRGALVRTRDLAEACAIANRAAPEHLELAVGDPDALLPQLRHAGAIFIGHNACEAFGDYCAGPNHVLPTGRTARFSSPLGVYDFQKRSSLIRVSAEGAQALGKIASILARGEGLTAHAMSAEARLRR